jgi:hypothetical protein
MEVLDLKPDPLRMSFSHFFAPTFPQNWNSKGGYRTQNLMIILRKSQLKSSIILKIPAVLMVWSQKAIFLFIFI